ncbi:hypothetical protein BAUCODRAFT_204596 [Baudoinia panamericana UAMH 10762]|uniref:Uncharacterized protein n=1 Tax=Baudoinia panamericana (strain UAMH 10762) TaxID=717646 RepID=M2M2D4_BAUPA|nr:uncharacterized protein BAUCODRAFT_204596 [Baudoinia panamericana UAMH 10762]EMD01273.1 hypothetical protein BAUCODRAFT_204596 [Baudoinia panamericana UAMH 10762]
MLCKAHCQGKALNLRYLRLGYLADRHSARYSKQRWVSSGTAIRRQRCAAEHVQGSLVRPVQGGTCSDEHTHVPCSMSTPTIRPAGITTRSAPEVFVENGVAVAVAADAGTVVVRPRTVAI